MQDMTPYLEDEFIIWNGTLGIRDFVTIGEVKTDSELTQIWLDEPYEFVGPLSLEELIACGQISFEACIVMTQQTWKEGKTAFQEAAFSEQCRIQRELNEDIKHHNKKRQQFIQTTYKYSEKEHRELLCLPIEGVLEVSQIKAAYRSVVKKVHPDVGGTHEKFIKITQARDALLEN